MRRSFARRWSAARCAGRRSASRRRVSRTCRPISWRRSAPSAPARAEPFEVRRLAEVRPLAARARRSSKYTREEVLAAIRRWADRYGEPPTMVDWEPARARRLGQHWRAERYEGGDWPTARMVSKFASFNA